MDLPLADGPGPSSSMAALSTVGTTTSVEERIPEPSEINQSCNCAPVDWDKEEDSPYPSIQDIYAECKAEEKSFPVGKDEIREYILYYMMGEVYVRPMGVFIGTKLEEFRDIIPYWNRRSCGEIGMLPYFHDFLLLSDHDYVSRVNDSPAGLYNVLILPSKAGRVVVMGESYQGFSFKAPSNIEMKGSVAIGRFTEHHGLVEKLVKQHSLVQVDRGSLVVYVCDCKSIVLVPDIDCRMYVKIIDESLDQPQLTQVEILGTDLRPGAKYDSLGNLLAIIAKWKLAKKERPDDSRKPQIMKERATLFKGIKRAKVACLGRRKNIGAKKIEKQKDAPKKFMFTDRFKYVSSLKRDRSLSKEDDRFNTPHNTKYSMIKRSSTTTKTSMIDSTKLERSGTSGAIKVNKSTRFECFARSKSKIIANQSGINKNKIKRETGRTSEAKSSIAHRSTRPTEKPSQPAVVSRTVATTSNTISPMISRGPTIKPKPNVKPAVVKRTTASTSTNISPMISRGPTLKPKQNVKPAVVNRTAASTTPMLIRVPPIRFKNESPGVGRTVTSTSMISQVFATRSKNQSPVINRTVESTSVTSPMISRVPPTSFRNESPGVSRKVASTSTTSPISRVFATRTKNQSPVIYRTAASTMTTKQPSVVSRVPPTRSKNELPGVKPNVKPAVVKRTAAPTSTTSPMISRVPPTRFRNESPGVNRTVESTSTASPMISRVFATRSKNKSPITSRSTTGTISEAKTSFINREISSREKSPTISRSPTGSISTEGSNKSPESDLWARSSGPVDCRRSISQVLAAKPGTGRKDYKIHTRQLFDIKRCLEEEKRESETNLQPSIIVPREETAEELKPACSVSQIALDNLRHAGEVIRVQGMDFTVDKPKNETSIETHSISKENKKPHPMITVTHPEVYKKIEQKFFPFPKSCILIKIEKKEAKNKDNNENNFETNFK